MEKSRPGSLKKRDMGITGAIIVIAQVISSLQSSKVVTEDIKDLRRELTQVTINQEKYFVKKDEMKSVITKLDHMNTKLSKIKEKIQAIQSYDLVLDTCNSPAKKSIFTLTDVDHAPRPKG